MRRLLQRILGQATCYRCLHVIDRASASQMPILNITNSRRDSNWARYVWFGARASIEKVYLCASCRSTFSAFTFPVVLDGEIQDLELAATISGRFVRRITKIYPAYHSEKVCSS